MKFVIHFYDHIVQDTLFSMTKVEDIQDVNLAKNVFLYSYNMQNTSKNPLSFWRGENKKNYNTKNGKLTPEKQKMKVNMATGEAE